MTAKRFRSVLKHEHSVYEAQDLVQGSSSKRTAELRNDMLLKSAANMATEYLESARRDPKSWNLHM